MARVSIRSARPTGAAALDEENVTADDFSCDVARPGLHLGLDRFVTIRLEMTSRSYNWTLHLDTTDVQLIELSETARRGYWYAHDLAEDAFERSRAPRRHEQQPPLTVAQLAAEEGLEPAQVARRIALARRRLFGNLTDAAIYKRLQRQRGRKPRRCGQTGCTTKIPVTAPANKTYCDLHASGAERIRRHRQHNTTPGGLERGYGHAGQNARTAATKKQRP